MGDLVAFCFLVCKEEKTFVRIDEGIALLGTYQCPNCKTIYDESQLHDGDYIDLIKERMSKR